jgi:hypothetical protein
LNSVYGSRIEDFLRILCQGAGVFACSAKKSSRIRSKTAMIRIHKQKGDHHNASTEVKISLFIAENPNIPSTN